MPVHHLTSAEYNNTVAHLLGTSLRPADFFPSAAATGFEANVGVLSGISQVLLQGYYEAARDLAADAFKSADQRAKILICEPASDADTACPRHIIESFGLRAWRRPLEEAELDRYAKVYADARTTLGMSHAEASQHVVRTLLTSPNFLFRIELDKNPESTLPRPLHGYELASRLSYLLWSSMPDQALFDAAAGDELASPEALEAQVDRMLSDPKSQAFFADFYGQWLGTRQIESHKVDGVLFPMWNDEMKEAMIGQANAFFTEFTTGDRPFREFLSAPHPESSALDALYANDPSAGRAGFLALPAFLTLSSHADRTSPTSRAKTLIVSIFCTDISPPPGVNIPDLAAAGGDGVDLQNVRKKLEKHRESRAARGATTSSTPSASAWRTSTRSASTGRNTRTATRSTRPHLRRHGLQGPRGPDPRAREGQPLRELPAREALRLRAPEEPDDLRRGLHQGHLRCLEERHDPRPREARGGERRVPLPGAGRQGAVRPKSFGRLEGKRSNADMKHLMTRRNMLRGLGVCLALPWLESLAPRKARAGETGAPKRFLLCSFPNGAPSNWWETAPSFGSSVHGADFVLPSVLKPFAPLKSKMMMVSRLGNYSWLHDSAMPIDPAIEPAHSRLVAAMTTCMDADAVAKARGWKDLPSAVFNGISVDQLIAQKADLGKSTSISSLQTGLGVKPGFFDYRSYAYNQAVSWKSETEPLKRQVNPKAVFDQLVAGGAVSSMPGQTDAESMVEAQRRAATEKSVIDA